jgi:hypothetical protein
MGDYHGGSRRVSNPLAADDSRLLEAVSRGERLVRGFRDRDIRQGSRAKPRARPSAARPHG